jgi:hypothetical protein
MTETQELEKARIDIAFLKDVIEALKKDCKKLRALLEAK